jgi:hypothetical protein
MTITFTPSTGVKQEQSSNTQFEVNIIGCMTDCNFYIPDSTGDTTGLAFRTAYHFAKNSENNKEICTCVGSMLCSVVLGFKNSIEEALKAIGVRPCFVSLPSQAHENNIVASEISQLEWPSILLIFGYFLIVLLKPHNDSDSFDEYHDDISDHIQKLQAEVTYDLSYILDIPFNSTKAYAINTMLGSLDLRETVKKFLKNSCIHPNSQIRNMCEYLCNLI